MFFTTHNIRVSIMGAFCSLVTKITASVHQNPQHCHYMQIGSLLTLIFGIQAGDVRD
jgi:hypothetical protein